MASDCIRTVRFDDVRGRHLLAALSGGADSVALLALLCRNRDAYGLRISAAHFHHGIRGEDADRDADFCRRLCAQFDVEYFEAREDVPAIARERGVGLETAARDARYAFLRRTRECCGADMIALAHHLDDQAETVLMHLLRGAGPEGACGMARVSGMLYRPLLDIPKAALVQFLEEAGISWREDATNALDDNPRNALRLNVLPEIEKSYPSAAAALGRHARLMQAENALMERLTRRYLDEHLQRGAYGLRLMLDGNEDEAILRRALRAMTGEAPGAEKTDEMLALARCERGRLDVSGKWMAEKTPSALYLLPKHTEKPPAVPLAVPGKTCLPGICTVKAELGDFPVEPGNPLREILDADRLQGAMLRTRMTGDRIHPLGAGGTRLLSDYLTDKKIDRPLREVMPVIAVDGDICWAGGAGIGHGFRITSETRRRVRLTIHPITDEEPEVRI